MTRLSPSITTSDPDTPGPFTRALISPTDCSDSRVGSPEPSGVRAVSVTRGSACRSMPGVSAGLLVAGEEHQRVGADQAGPGTASGSGTGCTGADDDTTLVSPRRSCRAVASVAPTRKVHVRLPPSAVRASFLGGVHDSTVVSLVIRVTAGRRGVVDLGRPRYDPGSPASSRW